MYLKKKKKLKLFLLKTSPVTVQLYGWKSWNCKVSTVEIVITIFQYFRDWRFPLINVYLSFKGNERTKKFIPNIVFYGLKSLSNTQSKINTEKKKGV